MLRDFGVGQELLQKVGIVPAVVLGFPSLHGVALDKRVRFLAGEALADEREQHRLGVPHAKRLAEVFLHVFGIND